MNVRCATTAMTCSRAGVFVVVLGGAINTELAGHVTALLHDRTLFEHLQAPGMRRDDWRVHSEPSLITDLHPPSIICVYIIIIFDEDNNFAVVRMMAT